MTDLTLRSPAFANGDPIPERCGYGEANVNPPLEIDGVPDGAESLVLLLDDPDAMEPAGKVWEHWVLWNLSSSTETIPEDWDSSTSSTGDALEGENDFGDVGYGGPDPPDREHTYRFGLYALDTTLDVQRGARKNDITRAMHGHVLAHTQLEGTYAP